MITQKGELFMLLGILIILSIGFLAGEVAGLLRLPKLIGMLVAGIAIGPSALNILSGPVVDISPQIRMFALLVILLKAGLSLDREKILGQGSVAVRLGFVPAVVEATVVAVTTHVIFGFDWITSWLVGWIICAASPAVIVPMMLWLKSKGLGVKKGIPDLILAGGTASDAIAVTMFGIFLTWIDGSTHSNIWFQLSNIPMQIVLGIAVGALTGKVLVFLLRRTGMTNKPVQLGLISVVMGIFLLLGGEQMPYSPYLAIMVMGFVILETDNVLARRLRSGMENVWVVAEIFLFVLIGAAVDITIIGNVWLKGAAVVLIGFMIGRWSGIFLSTLGSIISIRERVFMVVGDVAKATVQAAIGGIPLAMGLPHGGEILAISVISILITAPMGAFGTQFLAPRMLEKSEVDPTKINVHDRFKFLVVTNGHKVPPRLIRETARIARKVDGKLLILNVNPDPEKLLDTKVLREDLLIARDINHEVILTTGDIVETTLKIVQEHQVDYIYLSRHINTTGTDDISAALMESCGIPVVIIDEKMNVSDTL